MRYLFNLIDQRLESKQIKMIFIQALLGTLGPVFGGPNINPEADKKLYEKVYEGFDYSQFESKISVSI